MQFDIFEHSRDVFLRNAIVDALRLRDVDACKQALAHLAAECPADSLLPDLRRLLDKLQAPISTPLQPQAAAALLRETAGGLAAAAARVFGTGAQAWLSPLWSELATAILRYPFDPDNEDLHAAPMLLHAGRCTDALAQIETIAAWRQQPAPLAWMIEAQSRIAGFDALWPLLAELAWMAPRRAQTLAAKLELAELAGLMRSFDAEFEGEDEAQDFAWFPAWASIADPRLAAGLRLSREGAHTPAESCARIVLRLLALERQGRHAEVVENRRKLRETHPALFARYMQSR